MPLVSFDRTIVNCDEVKVISLKSGRSRFAVAGLLFCLWSKVVDEGKDLFLPSTSKQNLPDLIGETLEFWDAVQSVGWLKEENGGLQFSECKKWIRVESKANGEKLKPAPDALFESKDAKPEDPILMTFPCVGKGSKEWHLTQSIMDDFDEAYGAVISVPVECRKALTWLRANEQKRKTHGGMRRFLNRWLSQAVDRAKPMDIPRGFQPPVRLGHLSHDGKLSGSNDVF